MKKVIKEIREGSVTYGIDDKGVLKKMHNDLPNESVMIPRVLPSGDVITAIAPRFRSPVIGSKKAQLKL